MARHYVLSPEEFLLVRAKRRAFNRLGFAVQLCLLRHPGQGLGPGQHPPATMVGFVAAQLDVPAAVFADYARRDQTRREHAIDLQAILGLRAMGRIERTLFTLQWLSDPALRQRSHAGLNKGEAGNALRRAVFFHRQGEFRGRIFENQSFRAEPAGDSHRALEHRLRGDALARLDQAFARRLFMATAIQRSS